MNCWEILQLSPDADPKAIKKQYAAKVKKTKPNEDPEGFQRLHSAYKEAMQWAKSRPVEFSSPSSFQTEHYSSDSTAALRPVNEPASCELESVDEPKLTENLTEYSGFQWWEQWGEICLGIKKSAYDIQVSFGRLSVGRKAVSRFKQTAAEVAVTILNAEPTEAIEPFNAAQLRQEWYQEADALLNDSQRLNQIEHWEALLSQDIFLDITLRPEFSEYLFGCVVQRLESTTSTNINQPTLKYLNEKLLWTEQRSNLEYAFSDEDIQLMFDHLGSKYTRLKRRYMCPEIHQGDLIQAGMNTRILACLLDVIAAGAFAFCLLGVGVLLDPKQSIDYTSWLITSGLMLVIFTTFMEASPVQGSLGKMLLGIKVLSHEGKRLSGWKSFVRQAVFWISVRYVIFAIVINAFFLKSRQFAHDRGSQSMVVLR